MDTTERTRRPRRDHQAFVAVVRCAPDRGLAALEVIDDSGAVSEHFVPFAINESPSQHGHDYTYAGILAGLERLRTLGVKRVLVQTDDPAVVAQIERRADPHRDLTLPYIMLGCKLNEFASARLVAVAPRRLAALRAKALALAETVYQNVA
jgi:hypothetical protein